MRNDEKESLAIVNIPVQAWEKTYEEETALRKGTVFPALCKPFYVTDEAVDSPVTLGGCKTGDGEQQEREQLMNKINQVSFFLNDLTLYLDTHGEDAEALQLFARKGNERKALLEEFANRFYPLTQNCIADCGNAASENLWAKGPAPWEGACV